MRDNIKVVLSVCESVSDLELQGKSFAAGETGAELLAKFDVDEQDILTINIEGFDVAPKVSDASKVVGISVRYCDDTTSVIAVYDDVELNMKGCCSCCVRNGRRWCAYGSVRCWCC